MLEQIAATALQGAACIAVGTRPDSLASSSAPEKICLEAKLLRGLGTGGDPERGRAVAEENAARLKASCEGADVIFIVAGLGGGAGTGVSPVLARVARETGALVLAFVTLPFDCEGNRRRDQARQGLMHLKAEADGVICLPNQKVFKLINDTTSVADTFKITNEFLAGGLKGVWRLLALKGLIEIHFADLCALLRDRHGESAFATAHAEGPTRAREAVDQLLAHPMLDAGKALADADAVLVSMAGGPDLTMVEVNRVMEHINSKCPGAQVVMGAAIDENFRERLAITLIATRRSEPSAAQTESEDGARPESAHPVERLDQQLLNRVSGARPQSRYIPPPPRSSPNRWSSSWPNNRRGPGARARLPPGCDRASCRSTSFPKAGSTKANPRSIKEKTSMSRLTSEGVCR